jgi:charged multivesicular body protein 6
MFAIQSSSAFEQNDALVSRHYQLARDLLKQGQKDKAKLLLRKKKYHESLIAKTYDKLESIDVMVGESVLVH